MLYLSKCLYCNMEEHCQGCAYWDNGCSWTDGNGTPPCELWLRGKEEDNGEVD